MPQGGLRKVLVTGASGFIGACAVRRLVDSGYEVHCLLRPTSASWRLVGIMDRVRAHAGDVSDARRIEEVVAGVTPDVVLHLATHGAYEWQADAARILATNVIGSYNLFAASARCRVPLLVSAGSSSEYGFSSEPMSEEDRLEPNSVYAAGKAAQAHLLKVCTRASDGSSATFRLFSVYGPWEEPSRLLPTVIRRARAGEPLEMVAPETARDFVHVDDVLDALLAFDRLSGLKGEVFNLGSGTQSTMRDVVDAVREVTGSRSPVRWGTMPARRWDSARWVADVTKTSRQLGWSARLSLKEGIARMADWMSSRGDHYGPGTG